MLLIYYICTFSIDKLVSGVSKENYIIFIFSNFENVYQSNFLKTENDMFSHLIQNQKSYCPP